MDPCRNSVKLKRRNAGRHLRMSFCTLCILAVPTAAMFVLRELVNPLFVIGGILLALIGTVFLMFIVWFTAQYVFYAMRLRYVSGRTASREVTGGDAVTTGDLHLQAASSRSTAHSMNSRQGALTEEHTHVHMSTTSIGSGGSDAELQFHEIASSPQSSSDSEDDVNQTGAAVGQRNTGSQPPGTHPTRLELSSLPSYEDVTCLPTYEETVQQASEQTLSETGV
eukprot:scpid57688/ scgid13775/ 